MSINLPSGWQRAYIAHAGVRGYTKTGVGEVWREHGEWCCAPTGSIMRHGYRTMRQAMNDCAYEAHGLRE